MFQSSRRQQKKLLQLYIAHYTGCTRSNTSSSSSRKKPPISQKVRFIDSLRVVAKGGHGGGGASALFGRTGHHPRAAGGNGAPGGSVVLRASKQLTGLGSIPLHIEAARGGNGGKQWMEGKKGPDRIVDVPLGTLVYQLVQLKGDPATPHGVTAMAPASYSSSNSSRASQPSQQISAVSATDVVEAAAAPSLVTGHSSSAGRRRLFPEIERVQHHRPDAAQSVGLDEGTNTPAVNGNSSTDSSKERKAAQQYVASSCSIPPPASAEAAISSNMDEEGCDIDALYEELLSCKRALTNAEKLSLLNSGRLPNPLLDIYGGSRAYSNDVAAAAWLGGTDHGNAGEVQSGTAVDQAATESDDEDWIVLPPAEEDNDELAATAVRSSSTHWEELKRQFTKKQVWSILESQAVLLGELTQEGQTLAVATGGKGGRGNAVSPSKPHGPASRARGDGQPGQEVMLLLKLQLLADAVLVGLPNVGKSSLISALTHARAQVGSYAFTTLRPQLGVLTDEVSYDSNQHTAAVQPNITSSSPTTNTQHSHLDAETAASEVSKQVASSRRLVLADLPGLVPGAHAGKGRGTAFLAHLQRARCLALVIDMTGRDKKMQQQLAVNDSSQMQQGAADHVASGGWGVLVPYTPGQQLAILQEELSNYDASVLELPMVIIANKLDALSPNECAAALKALKAVTSLPIVPVSARHGLGLQRLKAALQLLANSSTGHLRNDTSAN